MKVLQIRLISGESNINGEIVKNWLYLKTEVITYIYNDLLLIEGVVNDVVLLLNVMLV